MKILISDYDDTLFIDGKVSEENITAIKKFQDEGNLFIVGTGRHLDSIFEEADKYGFSPDFFIGNNGNTITDKDKNILYLANFDNGLAKDIVKYFDDNLSNKVYFLAADNGYNFGPKIYNEGCEFLALSGKDDDKNDINRYINEPLAAMFGKAIVDSDAGPIVKELNDAFSGRAMFFHNDPYIDIVEEHNDKGTAIKWLVENFDFDESKIHSVGDGLNDLSMLKPYKGYAMKNAVDGLKKEIKDTTDSVADLINKII